MQEVLVEARGLVKTYADTTAVDGIDLTIRAGEVYGLLGPNGAGKTTTVLMLLGLSEPDEGRVRVCGLDPAREALVVKRHVGYLPDTVGFYEHMSGRENLRYTAHLNDMYGKEPERRIDELLERVGLRDVADRPVRSYSRGMRQRLGLADALVKDPLVVILDEPMVGIDPEGVLQMQALIAGLATEEGRAVLLTSHLLHQVQQTCDRMAIFVDGSVVAEGTASELAARLADGHAVFEIVSDSDDELIRGAVRSEYQDGAAVRVIGTKRWRVDLPAGEASRLVPALVAGGVDVHEVRDLGSDLDEIYHRYFTPTQEVSR
jgi:ABC-2 type transport system ATP-binding protein